MRSPLSENCRRIIVYMQLDGFDPPAIGEPNADAFKKIADYIKFLRERDNA